MSKWDKGSEQGQRIKAKLGWIGNCVKVPRKLLVLLGFFLVRIGSKIPIKGIQEKTTGELVAAESWMFSDYCGDQ